MVTAGTLLLAVFLPILRLVDGFDGYLPLLVFITLAACYHSVCEQYVRASGDTMLFAKQGLMNTMLVVTLNIVLAVGLSDCICTAYLIIKKRLWGNLTVHPNKHMLKKMLRYSIPLIPTTVFWWITSVSDRYMIAAILGSEWYLHRCEQAADNADAAFGSADAGVAVFGGERVEKQSRGTGGFLQQRVDRTTLGDVLCVQRNDSLCQG